MASNHEGKRVHTSDRRSLAGTSLAAETDESRDEESRLKAGCSQDWLPHKARGFLESLRGETRRVDCKNARKVAQPSFARPRGKLKHALPLNRNTRHSGDG